jgi:hypothetical protein
MLDKLVCKTRKTSEISKIFKHIRKMIFSCFLGETDSSSEDDQDERDAPRESDLDDSWLVPDDVVIAREDSDSDQSDLPDEPKSIKPKPRERVKLESEDDSDIPDKPKKTSKGFQTKEQEQESDSESNESDIPVNTKRNKTKPKQMGRHDSDDDSDIPDKPKRKPVKPIHDELDSNDEPDKPYKPKRKELKPEKPKRKGLKPDKPVKPVQDELDSNDEDDYGIKQRLPKKESKSIPKEEKKKYVPKTFLQSLSSDIACPT